MAKGAFYHVIPDQVFEDIELSQLVSIRENSFDDLRQSLHEGGLRMLLNPDVTSNELQHELSLVEQLIGEFIRIMPLFIGMAIGLYAIHIESYVWLLLLLLLPLAYFVRHFIVPLVQYIVPTLILIVALSTFVYWNIPGLLSGATLLSASLWLYGLNHYKTQRLSRKALNSEVKFIELYFKNVFLIFRGKKLLNSLDEVGSFIEFSHKHYPEKLNSKDQIHYCKRCLNRDYSNQIGIVCGLTKAKPDFEFECPDFDHDVARAEYEDSILRTRINWLLESEFTIRMIPYFLYGACMMFFLSEVNFWYSGMFFSVFRSGVTDWLHLREIYEPWAIHYGFIMPGLLLATGVLASTGKKWAFIAGFLVFFVDTAFTFLALGGSINWWIHLGIIASLFAGIKEIDNIKVFTKNLIGNG